MYLANDAPDYTIDHETFDRWTKQADTPYAQLSEKEKQSDRDQVQRYLPLLTRLITESKIEELEKFGDTTMKWADVDEDGELYYKFGPYLKSRLEELKGGKGVQ